jgi:type IV pilus assembly protein PilY1
MPWQARQKIKNLSIADPLARDYYVDGGPQFADTWIYPTATTAAKAVSGSEWRTVLVGGLRQGGQHYYALDVTNPDGINGPAGNLAYPGYFWEFPDETDPDNPAISSSQLPYMGETWGQPIITRIRVKVGVDDNSGQGYERWVAIVTGGFHNTSDPNDLANYSAAALQGRALYVIDIKTGKVLAEKRLDTGASDGAKDMDYSIPSTPTVIDWDGNGYADIVYVGDIGGNVWKWTIQAMGEDRVNDSSGLRTQPNWSFKKFFQAPVAKISGTDYYKPIFYSPAAGRSGSKLWLAFGTGERNNLSFQGVSTTNENNRFYVVIDTDPFEARVTPNATVVEADLTDVTLTETATSFANRGYFFQVAEGEKFVTNVEIFAGTVLAATFKPTPTANPCTSRGDSTLYAFSLTSGAGYFDSGGNPTRTEAMGAGLPTDPKTSAGPDGKLNRVYIEKSGTDMFSIEASDLDLSGGGVYWRELP